MYLHITLCLVIATCKYNKNLRVDLPSNDILFTIFVTNSASMFEDFRLKIFLTVVREGNFTRAASELGITQPSVSQNIAELERQLGTRLFDRLRGEVVLLPAGRIFKDYAEKILHTYDESAKVLSKFSETVVMVSASDEVYDYIVGDLLADFLELHSEISFQKAFITEPDLKISLKPDQIKRGMLTLSYHPSNEFSKTRLWSVLSDFLKPTL